MRVCVCLRCAECESAWHYCLYCKSCCNFVKISTLLVCPPARWSLSSVQQCHRLCAPVLHSIPCPSFPIPLLWTLSNAADLSAVSAITVGLFLLIVGICIRRERSELGAVQLPPCLPPRSHACFGSGVKVERKLNIFVCHCSPSQGASCSTLEAIKLLQFTLQPGAAIAAPRRSTTGLYIVLLSLSWRESERERELDTPSTCRYMAAAAAAAAAGRAHRQLVLSVVSFRSTRQTRLVGSAV